MMRIPAVSIFAILVLTACGSDAAGPSIDVSGDWAWSETYADTANAVSCNFVGSIALTQSGAAFGGSWTGTESCSTPNGPLTISGSGDVVDGTISGPNVAFVAPPPDWHYQGTLSGNPPTRMSGTLSATDNATFHFTGTWQATR